MLVRTEAGGCSPRAARALLSMDLAVLRCLVELVLASTVVLLLRGSVCCFRVVVVVVDRCDAALVAERPSARKAVGSNDFPAPWRGKVVGL